MILNMCDFVFGTMSLAKLSISSVCCIKINPNNLYILSLLGTPDETVWPNVTQLPDFKSSFPKWPHQSISNVLPHLGPEGTDLITVSYCLMPIYGNIY